MASNFLDRMAASLQKGGVGSSQERPAAHYRNDTLRANRSSSTNWKKKVSTGYLGELAPPETSTAEYDLILAPGGSVTEARTFEFRGSGSKRLLE